MANKKDGTLYIGVTSNLVKRVYEHKHSFVDGFTSKYYLKKLVFFELHHSMEEAIKREKQLKKWNRQWKIDLIEKMNSNWNDLYDTIL